ncbi:hypothetical protein RCP99_001338 [Pseudomonas aeruginosa]|uniref:hypothetical protein n=1 Tax=Pseudomonas aeruginosa TaxID=287 RepID=UPI001F4B6308|nr:hypothetical protein [Pseudomonas aeruginosa]EKY4159707.1 hypothetical protein [Pseudomonas aeruginosa]HBO1398278.1 hypothetical protein [Pseudomonas aeruginosa]HBO1797918.1 hypothetical protein [Pseudomonas aeruginosa]HEJ3287446.1 hypothetical protein [Pseudomonas aeruginosa]
MNAINTIEAIREHLVLLGKELEFASGIRALAAEKIMSEQGITDPDDLFQACEDLIGSAAVFESYDDPLNTKPSDLVLGRGCPFPSLEAYVALRNHYGNDWLLHASTDYATDFGSVSLRCDPAQQAEKLIGSARDNLHDALLFKLGQDFGKSIEQLSSRFQSALSLFKRPSAA